MKNYILFSEEELTDLGKGDIIEHKMTNGDTVCFMCAERYAEMIESGRDDSFLDKEFHIKGE